MKKATTLILLYIIIAAAIGFIAGRFGFSEDLEMGSEDIEHRLARSSNSYKFISPLLECISSPYYITDAVKELERELGKYIAAYEQRERAEGRAGFVSVYYRDLANGPGFGIAEETEFLPASLAKTPLMISVLKLVEKDPGLLEKKIVYKASTKDIFQHYVPEARLEAGKEYSVKELLRQMIIYSDNDALNSLFQSPHIDTRIFDDIYRDFGIEEPQSADATIDVKTYATFFRVLYNGTYLSPPLSEFALETLSQTIFSAGLRSGVPDTIPIAHKFGERTDPSTGDHQLHDCGVVYAPTRPYVLCVLTRGDDFSELATVISEISEKVYETVTQKK